MVRGEEGPVKSLDFFGFLAIAASGIACIVYCHGFESGFLGIVTCEISFLQNEVWNAWFRKL